MYDLEHPQTRRLKQRRLQEVAMIFTAMTAFNKDGYLNGVVETPRGSTIKLVYDSALDAFVGRRALAQGLHYPYDWGFIPGTRGGDGDPVDVMILYEGTTFPGVVLTCQVLDMLQLTQVDPKDAQVDPKGGGRQENNRIIAAPVWNYAAKIDQAVAITGSQRAALEAFFLNATLFTEKAVQLQGWAGRDKAMDFIQSKICAVS
jgi:inorganic pyrophosphatase